MKSITRGLNQKATYWAKTGKNGFNEPTFAAPVVVTCRWQDKTDLIRNTQGKEVASSAVVYVDRVLSAEGYLLLGANKNISNVRDSDAREIIAVNSTPSLNARKVLHKVWL